MPSPPGLAFGPARMTLVSSPGARYLMTSLGIDHVFLGVIVAPSFCISPIAHCLPASHRSIARSLTTSLLLRLSDSLCNFEASISAVSVSQTGLVQPSSVCRRHPNEATLPGALTSRKFLPFLAVGSIPTLTHCMLCIEDGGLGNTAATDGRSPQEELPDHSGNCTQQPFSSRWLPPSEMSIYPESCRYHGPARTGSGLTRPTCSVMVSGHLTPPQTNVAMQWLSCLGSSGEVTGWPLTRCPLAYLSSLGKPNQAQPNPA